MFTLRTLSSEKKPMNNERHMSRYADGRKPHTRKVNSGKDNHRAKEKLDDCIPQLSHLRTNCEILFHHACNEQEMCIDSIDVAVWKHEILHLWKDGRDLVDIDFWRNF